MATPKTMSYPIATTPEIEGALQNDAIVAMGLSGGKDSGALALGLKQFLDERNHPQENRLLIHADLGEIEWEESLLWCEKLSQFCELPLQVVRHKKGGMIERWEERWKANWQRYLQLECLKLILPWSTPAMRFCTSELKTQVIAKELRKRWKTETILSATGIRAQESSARAKAPIAKIQNLLCRKNAIGFQWNPILPWTIEEVFAIHKTFGFPLHPAYTRFGSSRVSCSFCILSTQADWKAALKKEKNHISYKRLCELELRSAFGFQQQHWLCDLDSDLLTNLIPNAKERTKYAKATALERERLQTKLPKEAHFRTGKPWPPKEIDIKQAETIATTRSKIFQLYGESIQESPLEILTCINSRVQENTASSQLELLLT